LHRFHEAVQRALAMPESEWPIFIRTPRSRATPAEEDRMRALRARRDKAAADLKLDPALIAPKAILEGLACREAEILPRLLPWQRELLGV
jgi:ribonuclease D